MDSKPLDPLQLKYTARHEAGHAVACILLGIGVEYVTVKISSHEGHVAAGHVKMEETANEWLYETKAGIMSYAIMLDLGFHAEYDINDDVEECYAKAELDQLTIAKAIKKYVKLFKESNNEIEDWTKFHSMCSKNSIAIVIAYEEVINLVADALEACHELSGENLTFMVETICRARKLPMRFSLILD